MTIVEVPDEIETTEDVAVADPIATALTEARHKLQSIGRDSRNDHFNFDYTTAENMIDVCRTVLSEVGLFVSLDSVEHEMVGPHLIQKCGFLVTHIKTGVNIINEFSCPVFGKAIDKASFSCNTGIWKYYLRGLFMLPMGEFEEPCSRSKEEDDDGKRAERIVRIRAKMVDDTTWAEKVITWSKVSSVDDMTNEQMETIIQRLGGDS